MDSIINIFQMTDRVIAISSEVVECGKRVSDSKKKFVWRFRIGDTTYDLQLISSALSGKRAITLNDQPIYSEQNVLNIKFDFNHNLAGHSLRIFRESEGVHNYDLRIDNRAFDYLLKKKDNPSTETKPASKYEATALDPFSQFEKVASTTPGNNANNFGDFDDFSNFEWSKQQKKPSQTQKKVEQPKKDIFDFDFNQKQSPAPNTQTFQTTNNISNLQKNLNNVDLMNSDNFTTNNYSNYSNYLQLIDMQQGKSDSWGIPVDPKQQSFLDKIKPDLTGKQMMNKTLMAAVQVKKKATGQFDSLI